MRILVVGAGSTGGYFGGRLAQAGRDVTFLVRPRRAAQLRADGLQIVSPHGDVTLSPPIVTADTIPGPFDIVLLTVKAFSLDAALADLAPAVGKETMILPFLNGMRHVEAITERFGPNALVGCVCRVAATLDAAGRVVQLAGFQSISYGEMNGAKSERTDRLHETLSGAGFDATLSTDVEREMWEKWILLASLGGLTCLLRGTIGEIVAAPGGTEIARAVLGESVAIATACGHAPSAAFVANATGMLTAAGSGLTSSMYRDLMGGQAVEADQIVGDILVRGRAVGVAAPMLGAAYAQLSIYQQRRAAAA